MQLRNVFVKVYLGIDNRTMKDLSAAELVKSFAKYRGYAFGQMREGRLPFDC